MQISTFALLSDETPLTLDFLKRCLRCILFASYFHSAWNALEIFNDSVLYKCSLNNNNNNNLGMSIRKGSSDTA